MIFAHYNHANSGPFEFVLPASALGVLGGAYVVLALQAARDSRGWSRWRTTSFISGVAFLALALLPGVGIAGDDNFVAHMAQHLIIAMIAPIALVLGAPMTLLLRVLSPRYARILGDILRSRAAHGVANPVSALLLNLGGLYALYFTPCTRPPPRANSCTTSSTYISFSRDTCSHG